MNKEKCIICGKMFSYDQLYEYRGIIYCESNDCKKKAIERRDGERAEIIEENKHKTDRFRGLDLSDSVIGKANREILKADIEIAKKESSRTKEYEGKSKVVK